MNLQLSVTRLIENNLLANTYNPEENGIRLRFTQIAFYKSDFINRALVALDKKYSLYNLGLDLIDDADRLLMELLIDAAGIEKKDLPASLKRFEEWEAKQKLEEQK